MDGYGEMPGIERAQGVIWIAVDQMNGFDETSILDGVELQPAAIKIFNEGGEEQGFQFRGQLPHAPPSA